MKTLKRLKLTQLGKSELEKKQLEMLRGGFFGDNTTTDGCNCGCGGSSSTFDNGHANMYYGYEISGGDDGGRYTCVCHQEDDDVFSQRAYFAIA